MFFMANAKVKENLYQAVYQGSGTFLITKPKRKAAKRRQSKLKGTVRGARKSYTQRGSSRDLAERSSVSGWGLEVG